jgi:F-type H+-transporting ATPase subunit gamma
MATQTDTKNRISSVKNIQKITRAMEMVAAARLRKAEQRIEDLRPYARAIRKMTQRVVDAVEKIPSLPLLEEHESEDKVGILLVTGDRGLAGAFNSQILREGNRRAKELEDEGKEIVWYASGRRGVSSLEFRGRDVAGAWSGFTDRPAFSDAREIAEDISAQYIDGKVDRVEMIYNGYVSAMTQNVNSDVLLPLAAVEQLMEDEDGDDDESEEDTSDQRDSGHKTLWIYEPDPEEILQRLVPDYIEISIYRALLESTASEHGSRMTAMRSAQENASELIDDLTLQMNRQRQAEITQEIMEVVAGAEGLS